MEHRGFFVTGTDTNVGKTVVSALLCAALDAYYWKPIQTGSLVGTDREQVIAWSGIESSQAFPEAYIFEDPVSPHLAARRANRTISLQKILFPSLPGDRALIAEGAGGVLVPIGDHEFMTDVMRHVGLPVLLVTRTVLGTINHTLLSLAALKAAGLTIRGVIMVGDENKDNREAVERYGAVPVIGRVPMLAEITPQTLKHVFNTSLDIHALHP